MLYYNKDEIKQNLLLTDVFEILSEFGGNFTIIAFSALRKIGIDETRNVLKNWFTLFHTNDDSILE